MPARDPDALPLCWRLFEGYFARTCGIESITPEPDCLLAFNRVTYRGPELELHPGSGERLRAGDVFLEMHFRRQALLPLIRDGDPVRMAVGLLKLGDRDFPRLAAAVESESRFADVKALHALTLFHRGIERYGFEVVPIAERHLEWWFTAWQRRLMARDHPGGRAHVRAHAGRLVARHIWLSRERLIRVAAERRRQRPPAAVSSATAGVPSRSER
jgi:hypothetical protein